MLICCMRFRGEATTTLLVEPEGDWDLLKILMSQKWACEDTFDKANAWSWLRDGKVVFDGEQFFQVFNTFGLDTLGGGAPYFTAFEGEVRHIVSEELIR